jgi:hypothetical protein
MKRVVTALVALAAVVATVSFTVSTRGAQRGEPAAAAALWAVCSATVPGEVSTAVDAGRAWTATVEPAIGEHGEKRLVGCLEDLTLDRVVGRVLDIVAS